MVVDVTVALRPFLAPHNDHIEASCLCYFLIDQTLDPFGLRDARWDLFGIGAKFFAQVTDRVVDLHAQTIWQAAIRISVDSQNGSYAVVDEAAAEQ